LLQWHLQHFGEALPTSATGVFPIVACVRRSKPPTSRFQLGNAVPKVLGWEYGLVTALVAAPKEAVVVFFE
jgi:hypothetical protein